MPTTAGNTLEDDEPAMMAPEAPVFYPTAAEFADPLRYIAQIRSVGELSGICKIVPPPEWTPRFQIDEDKFRFRPRVQVLSQLDAKARVKVDFLNKLAKFWELQGTPLRRVPTVDGNNVDLYTMRDIVNGLGGFHTVCDKKLWKQVAQQLGFTAHASRFRQNYYKLLFPYDLFLTGEARIDTISPKKRSWKDAEEETVDDSEYTRKACTMPYHFHLVDVPGGHPAVPTAPEYKMDSSVRRLMKAHRSKSSPSTKAAVRAAARKKKAKVSSNNSPSKGSKGSSRSNSPSKSSKGSGSGSSRSSSDATDVGTVVILERDANNDYKRPHGRAPAGKNWDSARGVWFNARTASAAEVQVDVVPMMPFHWHLNNAQKRKVVGGGAAATAAAAAAAVLRALVKAEGNSIGDDVVFADADSGASSLGGGGDASMAADSDRKPVRAVASAAKAAAKVAIRDAAAAAAVAATAATAANQATAKLLELTTAVANANANTAAAAAATVAVAGGTVAAPPVSSIKMELEEDDIVVPATANLPDGSAGVGASVGAGVNLGAAVGVGTTAATGPSQVRAKGNETVVGVVSVVQPPTGPKKEDTPAAPSSTPAPAVAAVTAATAPLSATISPAPAPAPAPAAPAPAAPAPAAPAAVEMDDPLQSVRSPRLSKKAAKRADAIDEDLQMAIALSASLQTAGIGSLPPTDKDVHVSFRAHVASPAGGGGGAAAESGDGSGAIANGGTDALGVPTDEEEDSHDHDPYSAYLDELFCERCGRLDNEAEMLICDDCDQGFHMFCLVPPLKKIPRGDWRCPQCVSKKVEKPPAEFGFDMSEKTFSLKTFKNLAEDFKRKYFKDSNPSLHRIETEFWRLVTTGVDNGEHVKVFYGADLFTEEHGSGFPTTGERHKNTISEELDDEATAEMRDSPWNLNNLPVEPRSLLRYTPGDIAGMKIPWAYAGMCFSSFCWHNEDQWTYSVNYNHIGAPKTWYGIPGGAAEQFETAIRAAAPELFANQPNLLQHLVTLISPAALQEANVPVVRLDQHPGEFVVTFPRAYHGGYNAGFNLAEAVNFSTCDWLPLGRECQLLYNGMKRRPVFSQEEMVVALARDCAAEDSVQRLGLGILQGALIELRIIIDAESELRRSVRAAGVTDSKRVDFGSRDDDERICDVCSTTCYLSAVNCPCRPAVLACLNHLDGLCKCPPHRATLLYQMKVPELAALIVPIELQWDRFEQWRATVEAYVNPVPANPRPQQSWYSKGTLKPPTDVKLPTVPELTALSKTALDEGWDDQQSFLDLQTMIALSKSLIAESKTILLSVRPTHRLSMKRTEASIPHGGCTFDELHDLIGRISVHQCELEKKPKLEELRESALKLALLAKQQAANAAADIEALEELQTLVDQCKVRLPDASVELFAALLQRRWMEKARDVEKQARVPLKQVIALIKEGRSLLKAGQQVPPLILQLEAEVAECEAWQVEAHLMTRGLPDIQILEMLQAKVKRIETVESQAIEVRLEKAHEWNEIAAKIINRAGNVISVAKAKANAKAVEQEQEAAAAAATEDDDSSGGGGGSDSGGGGAADKGGVAGTAAATVEAAAAAAAAAATAGAVETTTISGEAEMQREGGSTTPPVGAKSDSESEPEPGVGAGADADADADAEIEAAPLLPTVAELAKLVNRGRTAQVKLPALRSVETRLEQCINWQLKLVHMFVGKEGKKPLWGSLLKVPDHAHLERTRAIRNLHGEKSESAKFCLCKTQTSGFMICCEVCEDWFHGSCVGVTEKASKKSDAGRFICKNCCRSRRPKPDSVERMINSASLLNILLPEVPILEAYVAAARSWNHRVEVALKDAAEVQELVKMQTLLLEGDLLEVNTGGASKVQLLDRITNLSRLAEQGPDTLYCTCRRKATADEAMIQCDGCEDWFHFTCINLTAEQAATLGSYACGPCAETLPMIDYEGGAASDDEHLYCVCRRPAIEGAEMIQCDDCEEWFHYGCVNLTAEVAAAIDHYTCGSCAHKEQVYCICRRPAGEGETMLQCDKCDDWFHIKCLGLSEEDAQLIAAYICIGCERALLAPASYSASSATVGGIAAGAAAAATTTSAMELFNSLPPAARAAAAAAAAAAGYSGGNVYCVCRRGEVEGQEMIQCDDCEEWFHYSCVNLTAEVADTIDKYMCGRCNAPPPVQTGGSAAISGGNVYCICRRGEVEGQEMIQCDDCEEWFHYGCVNLTAEVANTIDKYMCGRCNAPPPVHTHAVAPRQLPLHDETMEARDEGDAGDVGEDLRCPECPFGNKRHARGADRARAPTCKRCLDEGRAQEAAVSTAATLMALFMQGAPAASVAPAPVAAAAYVAAAPHVAAAPPAAAPVIAAPRVIAAPIADAPYVIAAPAVAAAPHVIATPAVAAAPHVIAAPAVAAPESAQDKGEGVRFDGH